MHLFIHFHLFHRFQSTTERLVTGHLIHHPDTFVTFETKLERTDTRERDRPYAEGDRHLTSWLTVMSRPLAELHAHDEKNPVRT